ncbi:dihydrodipicolinate synthase family protein [Nakamurella sp. A5-74]|uniref:Dihydrodipicolinate synthase family protein n=1 Tax=Nakamurella sp. A5-74 TaxID=3158264 RepID=A0AAU8DMS2_9ACTN
MTITAQPLNAHPIAPRYTGVIPPVVTPLTADREVDVRSLERLVAHLLTAGCSGLFPLGSSGETVFLTDRQRDQVLDVVVRTAAGQVPVLAGSIETTTPRVIDRVRAAEKLSADAVVITAPFYALVGAHEIDRHFRAVRAATGLPVLAYDIPVCVHTKLTNDLLVELARDGVIDGVKDSSGDDVAFRKLVLTLTDLGLTGFSALTGHEVVVDGMLLGGADGSVPGLANVDPAGYVRLHAMAAAGDWTGAAAQQNRLTQLFKIVDAADPATTFGATRGVGAFKTALMLLGIIDSNQVSLPMRALDDSESKKVRVHLEAVGLL